MNHDVPIIKIPINQVVPSATNSRRRYDEERLAELAADIRAEGLLNEPLVRPMPVGQINPHAADDGLEYFELIHGERRWRACRLAGWTEIPCKVQDLDDAHALERQIVENMHREDLTPIEEAAGLERMLGLRGADDRPLHTVDSMAQRLHRSVVHIYRRLKLRQLPAEAVKAVEDGHLLPTTAYLIAQLPDPAARKEAARRVLHPEMSAHGDVLTWRETSRMIEAEFMRSLRGAPFDQADPELNPEIGACGPCPYRAGNLPAAAGGDLKRPDVCTLPACFARKAEVTWTRASAEAERQGKRILTLAECERIFTDAGELVPECPWVCLDDQPPGSVLRAPARPKAAGDGRVSAGATWRTLFAHGETQPPVVVGRDPRGRAHDLCRLDLALAAAAANGHGNLFKERAVGGGAGGKRAGGSGGGVAPPDDAAGDDYPREDEAAVNPVGGDRDGAEPAPEKPATGLTAREKRAAREQAEEAERLAGLLKARSLDLLIARIETHTTQSAAHLEPDFWRQLTDLAAIAAGNSGCRLVARRRGWRATGAEFADDRALVRSCLPQVNLADQPAVVVELLLAEAVYYGGTTNAQFRRWLDLYKIDPGVLAQVLAGEEAREIKPVTSAPPQKRAAFLEEMAARSEALMAACLRDGLCEDAGQAQELINELAVAGRLRRWSDTQNVGDYEKLIAAVEEYRRRKGESSKPGKPHEVLTAQIAAALEEAGMDGITVKHLAEKLGVEGSRVLRWFDSAAAKRMDRLRKIGPAKYRLLPVPKAALAS